MRLKSTKAELKQRVKVSLDKFVSMLRHDCRYNIRFIFKITMPGIFRIPKNQNIPNTPWKYLNFSFSIDGLSNLNCLQGSVGKSR